MDTLGFHEIFLKSLMSAQNASINAFMLMFGGVFGFL